jgi:hypothetical protein
MTRGVVVEIGRIDENGTQRCVLSEGSVVEDLLDQSGYDMDMDKEKLVAHSTGRVVTLDTALVNGEVYIISPNIESA